MLKKLLIVLISFGIVGCASGITSKLNNSSIEEQEKIEETKSKLAFEATTSLSMMTNIQSNINYLRRGAYNPVAEEIENIKNVLHQIDVILLNDSNFEISSYESDREDYKYKDIVTFKNFNNEDTSYILYYSEVKEKVDQDFDDNEVEVKTIIKGLAVVDEFEYEFKSVTEIENEDNEVEETSTFMLYRSEDSYIKVAQEYEEEDNEVEKYYRYTIVENGNKVYDYRLDYEKDDNKKNEIEIELTLNNLKFKIEELTIEGTTYLQVKFVEIDTMGDDSSFKVLFKKVLVETDYGSYVSYELVE